MRVLGMNPRLKRSGHRCSGAPNPHPTVIGHTCGKRLRGVRNSGVKGPFTTVAAKDTEPDYDVMGTKQLDASN